MHDNKLGDKLELPYPGGSPPGESIDTPFQGNNAKSHFSDAEKSYDPPQATKKAAPPSSQPREQTAVPTAARKNSPTTRQLDAFRRIFGLARVPVRKYVVKRVVNDELVSITFSLRPMSHEDYQWVLEKSASLRINEITARFAAQMAAVAISICSMDEGDLDSNAPVTPIWEVFGLEPEKPEYIRDQFNPHVSLKYAAADLMWDEVRNTLYDFVNELFAVVDSLAYPEKDGEENPLAQTTSEPTTTSSGSEAESPQS